MTLNLRRQALGLTFESLAIAAGLSERTCYRLMVNNALPKSRCAQEQLAAALKVDLAGLSALVAAKATKRGSLASIVRSGSARRAHAHKRTTRGAL